MGYVLPSNAYAIEKNRLGFVVGYGASHPDWGGTEVKVETIDLALRYKGLPERAKGRQWYKNRHSLDIEVPLHIIRKPYGSFMVGLSFLSRWTFEGKTIQPYLLAGGGPLFSNAGIERMSSRINGSYQAGMGFGFTVGKQRFSIDVRYHHISNGGISDPNQPLNSTKVLFGVDLF